MKYYKSLNLTLITKYIISLNMQQELPQRMLEVQNYQQICTRYECASELSNSDYWSNPGLQVENLPKYLVLNFCNSQNFSPAVLLY